MVIPIIKFPFIFRLKYSFYRKSDYSSRKCLRSEGSITEKVITGAITGKIHHEVDGVNPVGHSVDIYDVIIYYVISGCQCGHQSFFTITPISDEFMELGSGKP